MLSAFAESIELAAECGARNWQVSIKRRRGRLNSGRCRVFDFTKPHVLVTAIRESLSAEAQHALEGYLGSGDDFKSVPGGFDYHLPYSRFAELFGHIRAAHHAFIRVSGQGECPFRRSHSPAFIRYLNETLVVELPQPEAMHEATDEAERAWKVSPGPSGEHWSQCKAGGFIAIGWDELGDLSGLSRAAFDSKVEDLIATNPQLTKHSLRQVWRIRNLRVGDRIVANAGTEKVLGTGVVDGDYYYASDAPDGYRHRVPVKWDDIAPFSVEKY